MNAKQKDGATLRDHAESSARGGSEAAIRALTEPDFPDELGYLLTWAHSLVGRSGVGMAGLAPLSHAEVVAWAALTDSRPEPWEIDALMEIDAALRWRESDEDESKPDEAPAAQKPVPAWPERRREPVLIRE